MGAHVNGAQVVAVVRGAQAVATVVLVAGGAGLLGSAVDSGAGRVALWVAVGVWATVLAEIVVRGCLGGVRALRRRGARGTRDHGTKDGAAPDGDGALPGAVVIHSPVAGRWRAFNSPADKVPSHGTHYLAQTYAIDVVRAPGVPPAPTLRWWPPFPANRDFPAYGAPVLAPAAGRVVTAAGSAHRDHRARNTLPGLAYFFVVEQLFRSVAAGRGFGAIVGNHLVLELADGSYALFAHLRRGSTTVHEGAAVRAGQQLAECGNSGNSTEPHVHFQLMDGPDPRRAKGVPFTWRGVGVPRNGTYFTASPASSDSPDSTAAPARTPETGDTEADRPEAGAPEAHDAAADRPVS